MPIWSLVKITVGHLPRTDQFSKIAVHFLVWSDIFQIKEGWFYTVVLTCVVGVATFSVAGRLTSQVGPLYTIVQNKYFEFNTNKN